MAAVPWGAADADIVGRLVDLAVHGATEALGAVPSDLTVDVMLALPEARPGLPDGFAVDVERRFAEALREITTAGKVRVLPRGHAGGLVLFADADAALRAKDDTLILVGGTDSWLAPETLEWLDSIEALHSDSMPWGFCSDVRDRS